MAAIPNFIPQTKTYSFEQYLEIEAQNEHKSEFYDGVIVAMAGGTIEHSTLTQNINFLIRQRLKHGCNTHNNDIKVFVKKANRGFYPDVSVVCGEIESHNNRNGVIINPSVIVEVLSDSTETYDRTAKFDYYKLLPSFKCYILVNQNHKCVEIFTKKGDFWACEIYYENKPLINIEVLEMTFNIEEVYQGVTLPPPPPPENHDDLE
jgi:Uma2 family endonuclease